MNVLCCNNDCNANDRIIIPKNRYSDYIMSHKKQPNISSRQFAISPDIANNSTISYDSSSSSVEESDLDSIEENNIPYESTSNNKKSRKNETSKDPENFSNFNSVDYLYETLNDAVNNNNGVLDKTLALQAQSSGMLTAKTIELQSLEKEVMNKLSFLKKVMNGDSTDDKRSTNLENGDNDNKDSANDERIPSFKELFNNCQSNLLWSEKRLNSLFGKVSSEYPIEFNEAKNRVLSREEFNEIDKEDLKILQRGI